MAVAGPDGLSETSIDLRDLMERFYADPDQFATLSRRRCSELSAKGAVELHKRLEYIDDIRKHLSRIESVADDVEFLNNFWLEMRDTRITRSNGLRRIIMSLQQDIKKIIDDFKETKTNVGINLKMILEEQQQAKDKLHTLIVWVLRFFRVYQEYLSSEERYINDLLVAGRAPIGEITQKFNESAFSLIEVTPANAETFPSLRDAPAKILLGEQEALIEITPPPESPIRVPLRVPPSNWFNLQESFVVKMVEGDQEVTYLLRPLRVHEQSSVYNILDGRRMTAVEVINQTTGEKYSQLVLFEREQDIVLGSMARERVVDVFRQPNIAKVLERAMVMANKKFLSENICGLEKIKTPLLIPNWSVPSLSLIDFMCQASSTEFYDQLQERLVADFSQLAITKYDLPDMANWVVEGHPVGQLLQSLVEQLDKLRQHGLVLEQEKLKIKRQFKETLDTLSEDDPQYVSQYRDAKSKHQACLQNIQINKEEQQFGAVRLAELRAVVAAAYEQYKLQHRPTVLSGQVVPNLAVGHEDFLQKKVSYLIVTKCGHYLMTCDQERFLEGAEYRLLLLNIAGGRLINQKLMVLIDPGEQADFLTTGKKFYDDSIITEIQLLNY